MLYLDAEISSVNVIPEEEIFAGGGVASNGEEFHQIVELSTYVTTNWKKNSSNKTVEIIYSSTTIYWILNFY